MGTKLSNVIGAPFADYVQRQLAIRAFRSSTGRGGADLAIRKDSEVLYLANKTAWVRLISSVNVAFPPGSDNTATNYEKYIEKLGIAGSGTYNSADGLARNWILQAGTSWYIPETKLGSVTIKSKSGLRQGIGPNGAYGLGGTEELGYRPMPGLTSVTIDTAGRLGSLRTATVNFKVWNMNQLNTIEALYFRLGYTMLLEWGHTQYFRNYVTDLKDTEGGQGFFINKDVNGISDPFGENKRKEDIQQEIEKRKFQTSGNYDGMLGIVVNFNWSFNQDGGYDCSIKLVGLGAVINSLRINQSYSLPKTLAKKYQSAESAFLNYVNAQYKALEAKVDALEEEQKKDDGGFKIEPPKDATELQQYEVTYDDLDLTKATLDGVYGAYSARDFITLANPSVATNYDYYASFNGVAKSPTVVSAVERQIGGLWLRRQLKFENKQPLRAGSLARLDARVLSQFAQKIEVSSITTVIENFQTVQKVTRTAPINAARVTSQNYFTALFDYATSYYESAPPRGSRTEIIYSRVFVEPDEPLPTAKQARAFKVSTQYTFITDKQDVYFQAEWTTPVDSNGTQGNADFTPTRRQFAQGIQEWEEKLLKEGGAQQVTLTQVNYTKNAKFAEIKGTFNISFKVYYSNPNNQRTPVDELRFGDSSVQVDASDPTNPLKAYKIFTSTVTFTTNNPGFLSTTSVTPPPAPTAPAAGTGNTGDTNTKQAKAATEQVDSALGFESALHAMLLYVQTTTQELLVKAGNKAYYAINKELLYKDTIVLNENGALNGMFNLSGSATPPPRFDLLEYGAKGFSSELMSDPTALTGEPVKFTKIPYLGAKLSNPDKPDFKNFCQAVAIKYWQNNVDSIIYPGEFQVYIPLGYLLCYINSMCLFYDSKQQGANSTDKRPYVYIDFNPETNFCLTTPQQFSVDPNICLIPANLDNKQYEELFPTGIAPKASQDDGKVFNAEKENPISQVIDQKMNLPFKTDIPYRGKTMNILLCTQYLLRTLKDFSTSDPEHAVALQPFLERVMRDVNKALGNINLFRVAYRDDTNTVQIQDDQYVPKLGDEPTVLDRQAFLGQLVQNSLAGEIPVVGSTTLDTKGTVVSVPSLGIARDMQLKTSLSSKMASMLAISAQAATASINSKDHTSISWLNKNFSDRYKPYIQDAGTPNTGTNNAPPPNTNTQKNTNQTPPASPKDSNQKVANLFNAHVRSIYSDLKLTAEATEPMKNYYIERMSKVKSANPVTIAAPFIPAELEITLDGISGIIMGNAFNIPKSRLPLSLRGDDGFPQVGFIVNGLTHNVQNNEWTTTIKGQMIKLRTANASAQQTVVVTGPQAGATIQTAISRTTSNSAGSTNITYDGKALYAGAGVPCTKNSKGELEPDDCYLGTKQISPTTPGYPNVFVNDSNIKDYFPQFKGYERPNAVSDINISAIDTSNITIVDDTQQNRFLAGVFSGPPKGFIVHHTAGHDRSPVTTFYKRGAPTQYWIERNGTIHKLMPDGMTATHIRNGTGEGAGLTNSNTIGVEVNALNCSREYYTGSTPSKIGTLQQGYGFTPEQLRSIAYLAYSLGFNKDQVYWHGQVNSHKEACEGKQGVDFIKSL